MTASIATQPAPSAGVAAFLRRPARLLIGGEWVQSESSVRIPVIDPATGVEVASVADANRADVDKAVAAAREAFERGAWAKMLPAEREALIWRLADLIDKHADELAELESIDNGKTKKMAPAAPRMTVSRSASGSTTTGDLPPSSSDTRFSESVAALLIILPTSVEPVNAILSTPGCRTRCSLSSRPATTMLMTPFGKPICSQTSPRM